MVGNGKPVGFVPDMLDQVQGRGHFVQQDAGVGPFLEDFLFPLGQPDHRDFLRSDAQPPDHLTGGTELPCPRR